MMDSSFVRSFAADVGRKLGPQSVRLLEFPRSEHVRHLPEHPVDYQKGVETFMNRTVFGGEDVVGWGDDVDVEQLDGTLVVERKG